MRGHIPIGDDDPIDLKLVGVPLEIKASRTERVCGVERTGILVRRAG